MNLLKRLSIILTKSVLYPAFLKLLPKRAVVRPPGAINEKDFLRKCTRCGACIVACKNMGSGVLVPCTVHDGILMYGTPKLDTSRAYCEIVLGICEERQPCIEACTYGVLKPVKGVVKLGHVEWDSTKCIQVKQGGCLVCVEVCPMGAVEVGEDRRPKFDREKCIGCGRCVYACPASPKALRLVPEDFPIIA